MTEVTSTMRQCDMVWPVIRGKMLRWQNGQVNEGRGVPGLGGISEGLLAQNCVAVEKGTQAVISVNFSVYGKRTFNNLRTNFVGEIP